MFNPPAGILGDQEDAVRRQMQMQGLLGLASGLFQAGTPSRTPVSLGNAAIQGLMAGQQLAQGTFDQTLKSMVLKQQMDEARRKQAVAAQLRDIAPRLISERREPSPVTGAFDAGQGLDVMTGGEGVVPQPKVTGYGINTSLLPALAALGPEGMEYAKTLAEFQRSMTPKTSIQSIFDEKGREVKVRYNEDTGEYSPIGGAKAEPFIQVDRGDRVDLLRPSGDLVGSLPKGMAPTAPSYSWTDAGVLNTRTGQITQPTDSRGNPIVLDPTAKASEGERVSAGFYGRMTGATAELKSPLTDSQGNPILNKEGKPVTLEDAAQRPELLSSFLSSIPNWMGGQSLQNLATSANRQRYEQAQRNWVTANLRKESGAVIGVDEMNQEIIKYFPRLGDSDAVIAQKARARQQAEDAMRKNAGRALTVAPLQQPTSLPSSDDVRKEIERRNKNRKGQ
jgi:hypothetical protein